MRKRLRALWQTIVHEHTAPGRVAAAIVVGCIVGCTPLFGLHFFVCVALAWLLRLNKIVVYGAANLSIPPMVPATAPTSAPKATPPTSQSTKNSLAMSCAPCPAKLALVSGSQRP